MTPDPQLNKAQKQAPHQNPNPAPPPQRVLKKTPLLMVFTLGAIILTVGAGLGIFLYSPQFIAKIHGQYLGQPLEIYGLNLKAGSELLTIAPGGSLVIHPAQPFEVAGLDTNRWQNYDLSLSSPDFSVNLVTDKQAASPQELLSQAIFFEPQPLRLEVREHGQLLATFTLYSQFTALDWGIRGDAATTPAEKALHYRRAFKLDPTPQIIRNKLAQALIDSGNEIQAAYLYEEELSLLGPNTLILKKLLAIYTTLGNHGKRIEVLTKLLTLDAAAGLPTLEHKVALAQIYREAKEGLKAAAIYEELAFGAELSNQIRDSAFPLMPVIRLENIETKPEDLGQYLGELVAVYREYGLSEKELSTLKRLVSISPSGKSAQLWSEIVKLYDRSGDKEGRLEAWKTMAGHLPPGPDQVGAFRKIGQLATELGHFRQAQMAYHRVLESEPKNFNISLNLARLASLAGDKKEYWQLLTKALAIQPDNLDLKKELAQALLQDEQKTKARDQYVAILKLAPQDRATRLALIALLVDIKDQSNLMEQYRQLLEQEPDNHPVAYNLGVLYFQNKEWTKASLTFQKLVEQNPEDQDYRSYLLLSLQRLGKKKELLPHAMILLEKDPSQTVYRDILLNTYENAKDWPGYTQAAEKIAKLRPKDSKSWQTLARGQKQLKQKEGEAQSLWMLAETTEKNKVQAWIVAARAQATINNSLKAMEAYDKVLALSPKNQTAAKALLKLQLAEIKKTL